MGVWQLANKHFCVFQFLDYELLTLHFKMLVLLLWSNIEAIEAEEPQNTSLSCAPRQELTYGEQSWTGRAFGCGSGTEVLPAWSSTPTLHWYFGSRQQNNWEEEHKGMLIVVLFNKSKTPNHSFTPSSHSAAINFILLSFLMCVSITSWQVSCLKLQGPRWDFRHLIFSVG